jgi:hypothetical protein
MVGPLIVIRRNGSAAGSRSVLHRCRRHQTGSNPEMNQRPPTLSMVTLTADAVSMGAQIPRGPQVFVDRVGPVGQHGDGGVFSDLDGFDPS